MKISKSNLSLIFSTASMLLVAGLLPASAQSTTFTYQGSLSDGTNAANGTYDLTFSLWDASAGPAQVGGTVTNTASAVSNGRFTVNLDFGSDVFTGPNRWLEISVRTNGSGAFNKLTPRQPVTPTPYAIHATGAATLNGQSASSFAPASGSSVYVAKTGDTMTGTLNLPVNGFVAGGNQLVLAGGDVGIGTPFPQARLHVEGGSSEIILRRGDGSPAAYISGNPTLNGGNGRMILYQSNGDDGVYFNSEGSSYFRGGRVGIGTRNPEQWLDVRGVAVISGGVGIGTTDPATLLHVAGPESRLRLESTSSGAYSISEYLTDARTWHTGIGGSAVANGVNGKYYIYDASAGQFRLVVDTSGNVGIGTTSPTTTLDVVGEGVRLRRNGHELDLTADAGSAGTAASIATDLDLTFGTSIGETEKMRISANGNVGIGTALPDASLNVDGHVHIGKQQGFDNVGSWDKSVLVDGTYDARIRIRASNYTFGDVETFLYADSSESISSGIRSTHPFQINTVSNILLLGSNVGIGTTAPQAKLDVAGTVKATSFIGDGSGLTGVGAIGPAGGDLTGSYPNPTIANNAVTSAKLANDTGSLSKVSGGNLIVSGGNVGIGTASPSAKFEVAGSLKVSGAGNSIITPVLSITGGADVAEPFVMSGADIPKGAVVVIDAAHPGQLKLSERAYDKRVAGIVSGAGGVNPGLTLSQHGLVEGGQNVALTGRVYALADAADGPIEPGDLLTSSAVAGHAMKVTDPVKAQGAILGKAMSRLESGRGLVLMLVTLQ